MIDLPTDKRDQDKLFAALDRLGRLDEFKTVIEWLKGTVGDLDKRSRAEVETVRIFRSQGGAQAVEEFLETARDARKFLNRASD